MIADEFTAFTSSIFLTLFTAQLNCIMSYDVGQPWRVVGSSARGGSTCFCPLGNSWYRVVVEVEVEVVVVVVFAVVVNCRRGPEYEYDHRITQKTCWTMLRYCKNV